MEYFYTSDIARIRRGDAREFVVLLPQIAFQDLSGREKPEYGDVSKRQVGSLVFIIVSSLAEGHDGIGEQPCPERRSARRENAAF